MNEQVLLISFSGGRTSAYMAQWILNSDKYKDYEKIVVFANTGKEKEETLEFVNKCDEYFDLNVVWIEYNPLDEHGKKNWFKVVDYETASRKGEPFEKFIAKERLPNAAYPNCSGRLKSLPIHNYMKSIGAKDYYTAIGIRADEVQRINWEIAKRDKIVHPLVTDNRVSEDYIRRFWSKMPFDLKIKDYEGNCDLCWKKSKRKLLTLIAEDPSIVDWWNEMEIKYGQDEFTFFREGMSAMDLLELSKTKFERVKDKFEVGSQQTCMFDYNMDSEASCFCKE